MALGVGERVKVERFDMPPGLVREGLVVDNIGKSFRGRPVVKGVSLHLGRGEVVGLLGPNGAGKTTCFYMITGLIPVDYGAIYLDGENVTAQPMYQRARMGVGYLPQETSIFRGMSVGENVMAGSNCASATARPRGPSSPNFSRSSTSSICAMRRPSRSQGANGGVWKSRARSHQIRLSCCSMSPSQG